MTKDIFEDGQSDATDSGGIDAGLVQRLVDSGVLDKGIMDQMLQKNMVRKSEEDKLGPIADKILQAGQDSGVEPPEMASLLQKHIINAESAGNPNAVSNKGAEGLMQLEPAAADDAAKALKMPAYDRMNPEDNVKLGTEYIHQQLDHYNGDPRLALAAYNWGPGHMDKLLEKTGLSSYDEVKRFLPEETQTYVDKIDTSFAKQHGAGLKDFVPGVPADDSKTAPGMLDQMRSAVSNELSGSAQAEELPPQAPTPALPTPAPSPTDIPPETATPGAVPMNPTPTPTDIAQTALANASQAAQSGDSEKTLTNIAVGQQAVDPQLQALRHANAMQETGAEMAATAKVTEAEKESAAYGEQAKGIAEVSQDYAPKIKKAQDDTQLDLEKYRKAVDDFSNATIDPEHWWNGMSTVGKILFAIGTAATMVGGDPKTAGDLISKTVENDLNQQKAALNLKGKNIENRSTLMAKDFENLQSIDAAQTQARAQLLVKVKAMVDQAASSAQTDIARSNLLTVSGQLQIQLQQNEEKFIQDRMRLHSQAQLDAGATQGYSPDEKAYAQMAQTDPAHFGSRLVTIEGKPVGVGKTTAASQMLDQANIVRNNITSNLQELNDLLKKGEIHWGPDQATQATTLVTQIHQDLVGLQSKGSRMAGYLAKQFERQLPTNIFEPGLGIIGRTAAAGGRALGASAQVSVITGQLQKELDNKFIEEANSLMMPGTMTHNFKKTLLGLQGMHGMDPDIIPNN